MLIKIISACNLGVSEIYILPAKLSCSKIFPQAIPEIMFSLFALTTVPNTILMVCALNVMKNVRKHKWVSVTKQVAQQLCQQEEDVADIIIYDALYL